MPEMPHLGLRSFWTMQLGHSLRINLLIGDVNVASWEFAVSKVAVWILQTTALLTANSRYTYSQKSGYP
jgi:hypothetical protein